MNPWWGDTDPASCADGTFGVSILSISAGTYGSFRLVGIHDRERCGEGVALIRGKGFRCAIRARTYRRSAGHHLRCADDVALPLRTRRSSM